MNAYEPAGAYHRSVRLLYQISNHRLNYNITHINMVESRNYNFENKTDGIPKSKYSCYIAQPSMLCHNYAKFGQTSQVAQTVAYTPTLRAMNAREVTQFHLVNIACKPGFILAKYAGLKIFTSVY